MKKNQPSRRIWRRTQGSGKNTGRGEESNTGQRVFQIQDCGKRESGSQSTVLRNYSYYASHKNRTTASNHPLSCMLCCGPLVCSRITEVSGRYAFQIETRSTCDPAWEEGGHWSILREVSLQGQDSPLGCQGIRSRH